MTDEQEIVGQVTRTQNFIPDHGSAVIVLRLHGEMVEFEACSDTGLPIRPDSPVVVTEFHAPSQVVVSVNLPTPC